LHPRIARHDVAHAQIRGDRFREAVTYNTRFRPSSEATLVDLAGASSEEISSSTIVKSWRSAAARTARSTAGVVVVPVGL
jgi:hypothetical protein